MIVTDTTHTTTRTLEQRLAEGRLSLAETLRYGMALAESLRKLHDAGRTHGAVSPGNIGVSGPSLELLHVVGNTGVATPYTAPEILEGRPADARSDVFSFGAVFYEMLTGKPAFEGETHLSLAAAIAGSTPAPCGSPALDRFLDSCLAKDAAARPQRMQRILLELKLLTVTARRAESSSPARAEQAEAAVRAQVQQAESRLLARLENGERAVSEVERAAGDAITALRSQVSDVTAQLAAAQERTVQAEQAYRNVTEQMAARVEHGVEALLQRVSAAEKHIEAIGLRIATTEQALDSVRRQVEDAQRSTASDLQGMERTIAAHGTAIDSARTAMAQTEDLVERVVEALDLLQSTVLDQESRSGLIN